MYVVSFFAIVCKYGIGLTMVNIFVLQIFIDTCDIFDSFEGAIQVVSCLNIL